jgi:DNA-binding MarR family transcriptional regulator
MNRSELLKILIENLTKTIHSMNTGNSFPFGDLLLKKQQVMILFFIYEKKDTTSVKDIAAFLNVTPGAITQLVDNLVEKELVKREKNMFDGRIINIMLTTNTEKQFNKFKDEYLKTASKSFDKLSDQELKQFIKLIQKIQTPIK